MDDINAKIRARVESLVADLSDMLRQAALEAVNNALLQQVRTLQIAAPAAAGAGSTARRPAPPRAAPRKPGEKRPRSDIAALADRLAEYVAAHPEGVGIEQVGRDLQTATSELVLPVKKLLKQNRIRRTGHKRATRYFPPGRGGRAASATAGEGTERAARAARGKKSGRGRRKAA